MTPTQDIALGIYYLTVPSQPDKLANKIAGKIPAGHEHLPLVNSAAEVDFALAESAIKYHTRIRFRNPDYGIKGRRFGVSDVRMIETTAGRVIFNETWPTELGFVNDKIDKSKLGDLILHCHQVAGHARTVKALDELKTLGFKHACLAGVSMGLKDMIRPKIKDEIIAHAYTEVEKVDGQFQTGIITDGERHNKIIDIWTAATEKVSDELYKTIDRNVTEAARGTQEVSSNIGGVTQAAGETGHMAGSVLGAASELSQQADRLRREVDGFVRRVRSS